MRQELKVACLGFLGTSVPVLRELLSIERLTLSIHSLLTGGDSRRLCLCMADWMVQITR
jgi:hypothetical protein